MKKRNVIIILTLFIVIGFLLRSYNFSDWLRFNADQARDARLAINVSEGRETVPLLGPMAGGTEFKLGPIFYYFQIASVKIFGDQPHAAAYPDLLFSVLSIPLFFLLSRIFFSQKISLAVTWLYVTSYFMIKYSRFAWNPNSTPFFVILFLYSFHGMINAEENRKKWWAIVCGIALGISVQLHTSLLIILPFVSIFALALLFKKEKIKASAIALVFAFALFLNAPQIIGEFKNNFLNTYQFFIGATQKNERNSSIGENIILNVSCHAKANAHILTALGNEEGCGYDSDIKMFKKLDSKKVTLDNKIIFILVFILSVIFSLGGYFLMGRATKKEVDEKKRIMLMTLCAYAGISFVLFIAWATELSVRFFLGLSFVPFLLLGFWLTFLSEKFKKESIVAAIAILTISFLNFQKIYGTYKDLSYGGREINGDFDYATLGEENFIVEFLKENSDGEKILYLDAQAGYLFKMLRPLQFLAEKYDLTLVQLEKEIKLEPGMKIFYIKSADSGCELPEKSSKKYVVDKCSLKGQFSIFSLIVK